MHHTLSPQWTQVHSSNMNLRYVLTDTAGVLEKYFLENKLIPNNRRPSKIGAYGACTSLDFENRRIHRYHMKKSGILRTVIATLPTRSLVPAIMSMAPNSRSLGLAIINSTTVFPNSS